MNHDAETSEKRTGRRLCERGMESYERTFTLLSSNPVSIVMVIIHDVMVILSVESVMHLSILMK